LATDSPEALFRGDAPRPVRAYTRPMPTCAVCDGAIGPGAGLVTCSPDCRDERRRQRTREAHAARWASDPEWRARRTRATAVSLVRRLGDDAPAWAQRAAEADSL